MSTFPKVRHIAGRDRYDTGRVVIGIAHEPPPMPMGSEAERVQSALMRWPPRTPTKAPTLVERLVGLLRFR